MATILLVDDEPEMRLLTRTILEKKGYDVIEARDSDETLVILDKEKPDLILLDVMMPGLNGWDLCRKIKNKEELKDIPIIMFTIMSESHNIERSFKSGADAHINRPFDMKEFLDIVNKFLKKG